MAKMTIPAKSPARVLHLKIAFLMTDFRSLYPKKTVSTNNIVKLIVAMNTKTAPMYAIVTPYKRGITVKSKVLIDKNIPVANPTNT